MADLTRFPNMKELELSLVRNTDFTIPVALQTEQEDFAINQLPAGRYRLKLMGWTDPTKPQVLHEQVFNLDHGQLMEITFPQ